MNKSREDVNQIVVGNGLEGETGRYLLPPITREQLGRLVAKIPPDEELSQILKDWGEDESVRDPLRAPSSVVEKSVNLGKAGWGVIFAEDTPREVRQRLEPLLDLRRSQAKDLFFDLTHTTGDSHYKFMERIGAVPNARPLPEKLPYYLLLVGSPEKIPFRFQCELDVQYAVGRLHFDAEETDANLAAYSSYAEAVVAAEKGRRRRHREVTFFSVENPEDRGTRLLAGELVEGLAQALGRGRAEWKMNVIGAP
ncbi:MAG TPA: hypothetical protein VN851_19245, partial [Thermoanaerobaculia bacterium]|nr:hypothetical protein [Thermoanaerobaculia bacterium]